MRIITLGLALTAALTLTACGENNPLALTSAPSAITPTAARENKAAAPALIIWGEKLPGEKTKADNIMWGDAAPTSKPAFDLWEYDEPGVNEF